MNKEQSLSILEELEKHITNLSQEEKDEERKRIELYCEKESESETTR